MKIKIAVDGRRIRPAASGIGRFIEQLLNALAQHTDKLDIHVYLFKQCTDNLSNKIHIHFINIPPGHSREEYFFPVELKRHAYDLFLGPANFLPKLKVCPYISVVHDLCFTHYPELYTASQLQFYKRDIAAKIKNSDFILTDSEATKKDLVTYVDNLTIPIESFYMAVDAMYTVLDKAEATQYLSDWNKPLILSVGLLQPLKNTVTLIKAFKQIADKIPHHLYIVGGPGWNYTDILTEAESGQYAERIHIAGMLLDDKQLVAAYNLADLFVFPTLCEGFGRPLIEAMSCGTPVIASDIDVLHEIGGDAVEFFKPESVSSLSQMMLSVLNDEEKKAQLARDGLMQAKKFNWDDVSEVFVRKMLSLVKIH